MNGLNILATPRLLKHTRSRCPTCLEDIPASIYECSGRVHMEKACPMHGPFKVLLARDARFYHLAQGSPTNASCCGGGCCGPREEEKHLPVSEAARGAVPDPFERLSTCIALIEIVDSCNLKCPTCYASSPFGIDEKVDCTPFVEFVSRVGGVLARKGFIDILQLSGGEPTIHPEFFRILEWAIEQKDIGYILINTNAVRIAVDEAFRTRLGELRRARGKFELYMQFDGPQEAGQVELRGADLREIRRRAIDEAGALGVPTTLAMTVTPATIKHLGDTLRFGLQRPHVRGITFQPMFGSGRAHAAPAVPISISVGDVILNVVEQSDGLLTTDDFTPLPCGDPNCHTISYLLRTPSGSIGMSKLVDLPSLQTFLANRVDYRVEDLMKCGCESEPLGEIIRKFEIRPESPFRIFIKPFMDAWTFDQDRIDRCCTHVIRRDGSLDSFCRYYLEQLNHRGTEAQRENLVEIGIERA
jgi:uncharacterized radical SAM superfamily Fe-S cluster-containing enzyme